LVSGFAWLILFALIATVIWLAARETRLARNGRSLVRHLEEQERPLFCTFSDGQRGRIITINGARSRWYPFVIAVTPAQIWLYRVAPGELEQVLICDNDQLRWFGRPQKYTSGPNEIWLHALIDDQWRLIQLRLQRSRMEALVRTLKAIATDDLVTAYRRHRPYIHQGPLTVRPATQDVHGAWKLDAPLDLYLMPLFLVTLEGTRVRQTFPLNQLQEITAVRRLDRPRAAGLVRFLVDETSCAFALDSYAAFANALAEATKRTLEDPLQWQQKKKKSDDFDFFDHDYDDDYEDPYDDEPSTYEYTSSDDDEPRWSSRIRN
jgi:hypothetical protein